MSYYRRLIEESEKKRILGMHNTLKKNPTTRLTNEALSDFPKCVMNAGPEVGIDSLSEYIGGVQLGFLTNKISAAELPKSVIVVKQPNGEHYLWGPKTNKKWVIVPNTTQKEIQIYNYHCKCKNGKLDVQPIYQGPPKQDDTNCEASKTGENQQGGKDVNCKNKTPYNAITDAGMNFKDAQAKWIAANCNGTTPCIKGDATTNINLRNAFCDGTWKPDGSKSDGTIPGGDGTIPGGDVKLPDIKEIQACFGKVQLDMPVECKGTVMSTTGNAVGGGCITALVTKFQEMPQKMLEVILCIFAKLQIPEALLKILIEYISKNPQIIIDIITKNPQIIIDIITNNPQLIIDIISKNPQLIIDIITKNPDIIKQIPIDKLPDILKQIPIEKLPDIIKIPNIPIQLPGGKTIEDILKEFPGMPIGNVPGLLPEKKQKFIEPIFPGKVRD
jgi:hypothetical protein